jgi:deazaflavin-dependent oxidoreductase (nitroreductase family)
LTTIGRKTGEPRVNGLYYIEHDGDLIVVASNAGDARVPAWWLNLQARPEATVRIGRHGRQVRARQATPAEETRLWPLLDRANGAYWEYRRTSGRHIPIVILEPRT